MAEQEQVLEALRRGLITKDQARTMLTAPAAPAAAPPETPTSTGPEGFFMNPETGQMTSRELLQNRANVSPAMAAIGGGMQGSGLQFGDEVIGAAGAVEGWMRGLPPEELAKFRREQARAALAANKAQHPGISLAGEIGGALTTAAATAPLAMGGGGLQTILRGAGLGGVEGALYGAGRGEGVAGRADSAARDGLLGSMIGGAVPAVLGAVRPVGRAAKDIVMGAGDAVLDRGNRARVDRYLASQMDAAKVNPADVAGRIADARTLGVDDYRVMDALGLPGQRAASGIVRSGGGPAEELAEFLASRQAGQSDRVANYIDEGFGLQGTTADRAQSAMRETRRTVADDAYEAARSMAGPVNLNSAIGVIDDALNRNPILGESALRRTDIGRKLETLRRQMQNEGEQLIDFDTVLQVKSDLFGVMEALKRKGSVPPPIRNVYNALDEALEQSSAAYRTANDGYREASRVIDAVDQGASPARLRTPDSLDAYARLTPEQQAASNIGYGDRLLAQIENKGGNPNALLPLRSPRRVAEAAQRTQDPARYAGQLAREADMRGVYERSMTGSRTADNIEDVAGAAGSELIGVLRNPTVYGIVDRALGAMAPHATGRNEATRQLIAEALMSDDAFQILAPAIQRQIRDNIWKRVTEGGVRGAARATNAETVR